MTITAAERRPDPAPHLARATTGWIVDTSTYGARLALVRNHMKWNVKEAARECGQAAATWRLWEMEGAQPRDKISVSKIIATRTGCDYLWLVHGPDRGQFAPVGDPMPDPIRSTSYLPGAHLVATVSRMADPRPSIGDATTRPVRQTRPIVGASMRPLTPSAW